MVVVSGEWKMNKVVMYIGLIIWGVYLFLAIYREIKKNRKMQDILKKPFQIFRIDSIFFLVIYLIYKNIIRGEILTYLYLAIIITNLVYLIYDLVDNYSMTKIKKNEMLYYFGGLIGIAILFIYLMITKNMIKVSIITLIINLFIPIYVIILNKKRH